MAGSGSVSPTMRPTSPPSWPSPTASEFSPLSLLLDIGPAELLAHAGSCPVSSLPLAAPAPRAGGSLAAARAGHYRVGPLLLREYFQEPSRTMALDVLGSGRKLDPRVSSQGRLLRPPDVHSWRYPMRTLLYAIPALLALAGPALAEPQQLDEAQLG